MKKGRFYIIVLKTKTNKSITNIQTVFVVNGEGNIQDIYESAKQQFCEYFNLEEEYFYGEIKEGLPIEFNLCQNGEDFFKDSKRGYTTISTILV